MKLFVYTLIFTFSVLIFSGCSKDKALENRIQKKDGEWNIDQADYTLVRQDGSSQLMIVSTAYNVGTFTFDNNNGKYSYTIEGHQRKGTFTWSVDNQTIKITSVSQKYSGSTIIQTAVSYSGSESSKNKMSLEGSDVDQQVSTSGNFNQFVLTATFRLSKK